MDDAARQALWRASTIIRATDAGAVGSLRSDALLAKVATANANMRAAQSRCLADRKPAGQLPDFDAVLNQMLARLAGEAPRRT